MSNLETVKSALMLYSLQHGFPIEMTTSDLRIFIENFTDLKKLTSTALGALSSPFRGIVLHYYLYQSRNRVPFQPRFLAVFKKPIFRVELTFDELLLP